MTWSVMDAQDMSMADSSFDLVLDKSTLDTFACSDNAALAIATYFKEIIRVLRPGGIYFCVTYGAPQTRLSYFNMSCFEWALRHFQIEPSSASGNPHYIYICTASDCPGAKDRLLEKWPEVQRSLEFMQ